jgi:hypothetical protein
MLCWSNQTIWIPEVYGSTDHSQLSICSSFPTKIQKEHCRNFGNLELFALKQKITLLPCKSPFSWYPQSKCHVFVKMEDTIISFCLHMKNYLKSLATIITHQLFQRENHESPGNHQVIPPRLARFLHSPWMPLRLSSAVERLWTWSTWSRSPGQGRLNGLLAGVKHQKWWVNHGLMMVSDGLWWIPSGKRLHSELENHHF